MYLNLFLVLMRAHPWARFLLFIVCFNANCTQLAHQHIDIMRYM
jgi:hypothetical protein